MREIEISLVDIKAEVERKLIAGQDTLASKLDSAIQSLTSNQVNSLS